MTSSDLPLSDTLSAPRRGEKSRASSNLIVIALIVLTFWRLGTSEFTWWDDQMTIHHNGRFNPPTLKTLSFYWTTPDLGLFVPVTSTLWAGLAKLAYVGTPDDYGVLLNPAVFHVTSLLLHIISGLLVLRLLRRLIGDETPALAGALLFALHPVQVESLGWVSGMKDVLCWCFALAALLLYVRRVQANQNQTRSAWRGFDLPAAFFLMAMAILSKPTAMVLPAAMVVIDLLLLSRPWRRVALTAAPFFILTVAGAILARDAQFVQHVKAAPLWQRPFIVGDSLAFYVRQLVWPQTLTIDYGRMPERVMASAPGYLWWLLPAAIGAAAMAAARRGTRLPLAALLIAVIGIAPVSGIATFQMQSFSTVTDHYLYFSMLGVGLLLAWTLSRWPAKSLRVAAFVVIGVFAVRSWFQTSIWHDSYALFGHAARGERSQLPRRQQHGRHPPGQDAARHRDRRAIRRPCLPAFAAQLLRARELRVREGAPRQARGRLRRLGRMPDRDEGRATAGKLPRRFLRRGGDHDAFPRRIRPRPPLDE